MYRKNKNWKRLITITKKYIFLTKNWNQLIKDLILTTPILNSNKLETFITKHKCSFSGVKTQEIISLHTKYE